MGMTYISKGLRGIGRWIKYSVGVGELEVRSWRLEVRKLAMNVVMSD